MVMETPSPQCVGREFVRQYYTLLHEAPLHLHRFYSHNSCFVHGGVEKPGEEQPPVTGQSDIHKKICTLNFRDCHAKIRQVDSQATVGNAVVVQVTGELSNNGQPMRRFMQTFVLVPQLPKKYYVHNDIFRYQDEVFHDNDTDTDNADDIIDSETETLESINANEAVLSQTSYYETSQSISNGNIHAEEMVKPSQPMITTIPEPEIEREKTPEPEQAPEVVPEPVKEPAFEVKEPEKQPDEEPEVQQPAGPPKPVTWAAIARDKNQGNAVAPVAAPVPSKPVVVPQPKPVETKPAEQGGEAPQPQRNPRPNRDRGAPRERDGSRPGSEADDLIKRSRYPDSHQVFVGNLPHNTPDNVLKTFFCEYGKVVELRINKKGGTTNVPNFGFVVFEDEKAVQEVLRHRGSLTLADGHRLNVEEKKQRGESGRLGSGNRLGRGGIPGRGGMHSGPNRGGSRGGMGGPPMNRSDRGRGGFGSGPRR